MFYVLPNVLEVRNCSLSGDTELLRIESLFHDGQIGQRHCNDTEPPLFGILALGHSLRVVHSLPKGIENLLNGSLPKRVRSMGANLAYCLRLGWRDTKAGTGGWCILRVPLHPRLDDSHPNLWIFDRPGRDTVVPSE
jgi:hypothetical protein